MDQLVLISFFVYKTFGLKRLDLELSVSESIQCSIFVCYILDGIFSKVIRIFSKGFVIFSICIQVYFSNFVWKIFAAIGSFCN